MDQLGSRWTEFSETVFEYFFEYLSEKFEFQLKFDNNGYFTLKTFRSNLAQLLLE